MTLRVKPFYLYRHEDASGLSGVGVVAVGAVFPNGQVVFQWVTYRSSMEIYASMDNLTEVHGHGGKTEVIYGEPSEKHLKVGKKKKEE